jgi:hypothetical protein
MNIVAKRRWQALRMRNGGVHVLHSPVGPVYQSAIRLTGRKRRINEHFAQPPADELLPLIKPAITIRILLSTHERAVLVKFVPVGYSVAPRRNVDAHPRIRLHDPRILDSIRLARRPEALQPTVGAVVLPPIDEAVSIAVGFDADRAAIHQIGAHVCSAIAIGVVIEAPERACLVI